VIAVDPKMVAAVAAVLEALAAELRASIAPKRRRHALTEVGRSALLRKTLRRLGRSSAAGETLAKSAELAELLRS
jgi:hypothetical protein